MKERNIAIGLAYAIILPIYWLTLGWLLLTCIQIFVPTLTYTFLQMFILGATASLFTKPNIDDAESNSEKEKILDEKLAELNKTWKELTNGK